MKRLLTATLMVFLACIKEAQPNSFPTSSGKREQTEPLFAQNIEADDSFQIQSPAY
jgi:hypothetical protein